MKRHIKWYPQLSPPPIPGSFLNILSRGDNELKVQDYFLTSPRADTIRVPTLRSFPTSKERAVNNYNRGGGIVGGRGRSSMADTTHFYHHQPLMTLTVTPLWLSAEARHWKGGSPGSHLQRRHGINANHCHLCSLGPEEAQLNSGRIWNQSFESQLYIRILGGYSHFQGQVVIPI